MESAEQACNELYQLAVLQHDKRSVLGSFLFAENGMQSSV